jgi:hypothetical protein
MVTNGEQSQKRPKFIMDRIVRRTKRRKATRGRIFGEE